MSQQAHRPVPPTDAPGVLLPVSRAPATDSPLETLLDEVRSPGVMRADIDALIAALGRTLSADETPRARADLLLGLMARENPVGDYTGRSGTKVRQAARAALLSLGYPYALELPPELVDPPASARDSTQTRSGLGLGRVIVTGVSALYQTVIIGIVHEYFDYLTDMDFKHPLVNPFVLAALGVWALTLCALLGRGLGKRSLQNFGSGGLWLLLAGWTLVTLVGVLEGSPIPLLVVPWHLALWATLLMRPAPEASTP